MVALKWCATSFQKSVYLANSVNGGYPAANNQGLRDFGDWQQETPARYALLLNPDTELPFRCPGADVGLYGPASPGRGERPQVADA